MRSIIEVFVGIFEIVDEYKDDIINDYKEDLIYSINKMSDTMMYSPPEQLNSPYFYFILSNILNQYIKESDYETKIWCKKIIDIFTDPTYVYKCKNN